MGLEETLTVYCRWCAIPCGELAMDKLAQPFETLHTDCYLELVENHMKYLGLCK